MICVRQVHEVDRGTGECSGRVLAGECSRASALRGKGECSRVRGEREGSTISCCVKTPTRTCALLEARLGRYKSVTSDAFSNRAFRIQWNLL